MTEGSIIYASIAERGGGGGRGEVPCQPNHRAPSSFAPCSPAFPFVSVGPTVAFLDKLTLSPWMCSTCFCESGIIPALKPVQYIDICKRSLTFSEFSLCLSLWSCCMTGKNSRQVFPTILKAEFLLDRRKLTHRQNWI